ncbi:hypothetical protein [Alteromonas gracilis]|uniref:hypothetical protein n=1 Tax=Alteromonas gracilis TaxID=1479524 RepID=UPI0030D198A7
MSAVLKEQEKLLARILTHVFLLTSFLSFHVFGSDSALSVNNWKEDLAFYKEELKANHINLFHNMSEDDFNNHLNQIMNELPNLSRWQVITKLMRLTRLIGDGHTTIPLWGEESLRLPIVVEHVNGRYIVTTSSPEFNALLGAELTSLNKVSTRDIATKLSEIVPFVENEFSLGVRVAQSLTNASLLFGDGILLTQNVIEGEFLTGNGQVVKVTMPLLSSEAWQSSSWESVVSAFPEGILNKVDTLSVKGFIDVGAQPQTKTVYLKITSYPDFETMIGFSSALYEYMLQQSSQSIIIDLRESYGGDLYMGMLLASFLNQVNSVDWQSGVFVLTSHKTFSAAMVNARQFWRLLNAKIYGEPTGAIPNGFQDMDSFQLPHSQLTITYSKRHFRIEDEPNNAVIPDVIVETTVEDKRTNYDRVLRKVMRQITDELSRRNNGKVKQ